jgi:hypothetical protein
MSDFCSDLRSGRPDDAYSLTSASFRARTTQQAFTTEIFPQGIAATKCSFQLQAAQVNGTDNASMTVARRGASASWLITLASSASTQWEVTGISHRKQPVTHASPGISPSRTAPAPSTPTPSGTKST